MKDAGRTIRTVVAAGVFLFVASARGQVVPTQDGRELDASPALGSRYNSETPQAQINSQLYVTGQVSGLAYFHGSPGYTSGDQLQTNVPSSVQSDFNRRSMDLSQALGGQTYLPSPYYSRGQTVLGVNSILAGRAAPGSNVPIATVPSATSLGQQLYVDAMADYRTSEANRGARTMMPEVSRTLPGAQPTLVAGGAMPNVATILSTPVRLEPTMATSALPAGGLFGVSGGQQQAELARELYFQAHPEQIIAQRQPQQPQGDIMDNKLDAAVPGASPLGQGQPNPIAAPAQPGQPAQQDANQPSAQASLGGSIQKLPATPVRNQDVFMDMLVTLRRDRDSRREQALVAAGLAPQRAATAPIQTGPVVDALVEDQGGRSMVLHGLAGESKDRFNVQMALAGEQLRANQYYDAAYAYETASYQDKRNPLARIGRGLSLLGAGESLSASYEIERAVQMFPMLSRARIDLPAVMNAEVVRKQLELLDERVKTASPEARQRLEFLATFLYYNDQQFDKARTYAQKLIKSIQNESLLRAYAEDVLKAIPAQQPKTPPTPAKKPETTGEPTGASNSK
jgi:tetratricopeptide (TPR) repeat protein